MLRILMPCIWIVLTAFSVYGQVKHSFEANALTGIVAPHYNDMAVLRKQAVKGLNVRYNYVSDTCNVFDRKYGGPIMGFGVEYMHLGNNEMLGEAWAFFGHWGMRALSRKNHLIAVSIAPGIAYVSKVYDAQTNSQNTAISNHYNIYFALSTSYRYSISQNQGLNAKFSITHYSNGATKYPNRGLNQLNISLGADYSFAKKKSIVSQVSLPERVFDTWLIATIGKTDSYAVGIQSSGVSFLCNTISLGAAYRYTGIGKLGISLDAIINRADHHYWDVNWNVILPVPDQYFFDYFRVGLCGGHELLYKRVGFLTYAGVYVYNKLRPSDWSYLRTGFRYYLSPLVLNLTLKSVGFKAQYLEFGLGLHITHKK